MRIGEPAVSQESPLGDVIGTATVFMPDYYKLSGENSDIEAEKHVLEVNLSRNPYTREVFLEFETSNGTMGVWFTREAIAAIVSEAIKTAL